MSIEQTIQDQIASNPILLYMKGNPEAPQCGFFITSNTATNGLWKEIRLCRHFVES